MGCDAILWLARKLLSPAFARAMAKLHIRSAEKRILNIFMIFVSAGLYF